VCHFKFPKVNASMCIRWSGHFVYSLVKCLFQDMLINIYWNWFIFNSKRKVGTFWDAILVGVIVWIVHTLCWCSFAVHVGADRHPDHIHSDVIHVATTAPMCLYSMDFHRRHLTCVDLYDIFTGSAARYQSRRSRLRLAPLGFPLDSNIIIYDEMVCLACSTSCYC